MSFFRKEKKLYVSKHITNTPEMIDESNIKKKFEINGGAEWLMDYCVQFAKPRGVQLIEKENIYYINIYARIN